MTKEQPDLFPRVERPEDEITEEPEVPPEESARIQAKRAGRERLKKEIPEELAKLEAKLGIPKGPLFSARGGSAFGGEKEK